MDMISIPADLMAKIREAVEHSSDASTLTRLNAAIALSEDSQAGHLITDKDGKQRRSWMNQSEYDQWHTRSLTVETYDLKIVPKNDFGRIGYWEPKFRSNIAEGWNVIYTKGRFAGCQAMPGASWARTIEEAHKLIYAYVAAGGDTDSDTKNDPSFSRRFHALVRLTKD